jgi:hypothetical protein
MRSGQLEYLKVGGKLHTSIEAIERYIARLNGIDLDSPAIASPRPELVADTNRG